jgi:uncharacterized protein YhbP (UPF0306 family)
MPTQTLDPTFQELLRGRYIAAVGTENADGTIHLTAVWYLFDDRDLFVATSSKSRKARNIAARAKASLMVDVRKPGAERGVSGAGKADLISGEQSEEINRCIHSRYMSAAAMSDPHVGPQAVAEPSYCSRHDSGGCCGSSRSRPTKQKKIARIQVSLPVSPVQTVGYGCRYCKREATLRARTAGEEP